MYTSQKAFHETSLQQFNTLRKESLQVEKNKNIRSPPIIVARGSHMLTTEASNNEEQLQTRWLNQQSNAAIGIFGVEKPSLPRMSVVQVGMQSVTSLTIDHNDTDKPIDYLS